MTTALRSVLVVALLAIVAPALAEKRVALVIGNSAYKYAPALANPKNDAEGMAAALRRMKFEVVSGIDLDKPGMERLLRDFVAKLDNADLALVFYAGHGLQVHGRNYFVPVDARLERETDLAFEAVPLDLVQNVLEQTRRTNILIIDACRDNPLARNLARAMGTRSTGIGRGLGQTQAGIGTLIVYATQPGNVALDGDGTNSPFTAALLKHIEAPGLEVRLIIGRVRQAVIESTRDRQVPWDSSSLIGEVYLTSAPKAPQPEARPRAEPPTSPGASTADEVSFWQGIRDSRSAGDFRAYLDRWPNGLFATLARARIADIERAAADEAKRADELRKRTAEDQRADAERKARDEARQEAERKRIQADTVARIAVQRLEVAKGALRQSRYLDARRMAEEAAALVKEAGDLSPASTAAQGAARDLGAFQRELDKRVEARTAVLVREARGFIAQKKFAEAEKRLVEAEGIAPASTAAVRRELEAAQGRAEADAEARKRAADEAKPAAPDPRKQGQTANSWYAPERRRGLIAFAHRKATLEPGAIAALEKLAAAFAGQADYKITLVAAADRSEGTAAELQALGRARLETVRQWLSGKGAVGPAFRTGIGPVRGEGPEYRGVVIGFEAAGPVVPKNQPPPAADTAPGAPAQELARRLPGSQWSGPITSAAISYSGMGAASGFSAFIRFKAAGAIDIVAARVQSGVGGAYSGDTRRGTWSIEGTQVCATIERVDAGQRRCYSARLNDDGSVTLAGSGLLDGKRFSR